MTKHRTKEESQELFDRAGTHSSCLLNDIKVDGEWLRTVRLNGKTWFTRAYGVWQGIRQRAVVGGSFQTKFPHYVGTTVCKEWADSFDAFADWYTAQPGYAEGWDVDKDVLSGSKHYSPETCLLLPRAVNVLFGKNVRNLNVFEVNLKCGDKRWRTGDTTLFRDPVSARRYERQRRIGVVDSLQQQFHSIPPVVFEKARAVIPDVV